MPSDLRACILCALVKPYDAFHDSGCDNCEQALSLASNPDRILDCTTTSFTGLVGVVRPGKSWVARWQRLVQRKPGLYAVKVLARLPEDVAEELGLPLDD